MTETRYRSNVGIYAVLIFILFAAANLSQDPADNNVDQQRTVDTAQVVLELD